MLGITLKAAMDRIKLGVTADDTFVRRLLTLAVL